jgi:hypothetical protein
MRFKPQPRNRKSSPELPEGEGSADASRAFICLDQASFEGCVKVFGKYLEDCASASKSAGATMARMRLRCTE